MTLDIRGFVKQVLELMAYGADVDGGALEESAVKHGLLIERRATAEDCSTDWDYGLDVGDILVDKSDALKAYLKEAPR